MTWSLINFGETCHPNLWNNGYSWCQKLRRKEVLHSQEMRYILVQKIMQIDEFVLEIENISKKRLRFYHFGLFAL